MATSPMITVVQKLRRTLLPVNGAGLSDAQLLDAYLSQRDEAALAALVRRHGPMVWGVCRRILAEHHDAEDAFQATFLVFVRKAASLRSRELLANWLHGVAHRAALKARHAAVRRQRREKQVSTMPEPAVVAPDLWNDMQPILDEELSRLPRRYRIPILLCDLEGRTRKEAAQQLRVPEGTVASRLARARELLAKRLTRRGIGVAGGVLAGALAQSARGASVPADVLAATMTTLSSTTGKGVSLRVIALAEGVLKALLLRKLVGPTLVLLGVLLLAGAGASAYLAPATSAVREHASPGGTQVARATDAKRPAALAAHAMHGFDQFHLHVHALVKFYLVRLHDLVSTHLHDPKAPDDAARPEPGPGG